MFFLLRLPCATLSAYIVLLYMGLTIGSLWIALWAFLEMRSFRRSRRPTPKLLTHVRYGPVAILIFSTATIAACDVLMIQYSRWQIVRYIHSDAPATEEPSFKLYSNFRSGCVNGMAAHEYDLYADTPSRFIDDADPAKRARALQASMYVYDWVNLPNDGPSIDALKKAASDPDPLVREIAAKFRADFY